MIFAWVRIATHIKTYVKASFLSAPMLYFGFPLALTFVCVGRSKRLRSSGRRLLHVPPTPTSPWVLSSFQADGRAQHTPIAQAAGEDTLLRRARMLEELRSGSAAVWVQTR